MMKNSIELCATLNLHSIKPESGAPIMVKPNGASAVWSVVYQAWIPLELAS